ncbi:LjBmp2/4b [Loa loa]|uniref:LjBmp2/4b n=1 Tax=Loa loa TaxID=7209 RepID=A0A1S0U800_LOALO|nr:LjBmp2/4b [Loa loa]EFO26522.1 LjBmp2/4b [Loa loa]
MNKFLESFKPEILVEQRVKVHDQLITTPISAALIVTATIRTNFATTTKVLTRRTITVEEIEQKRNYHCYRAQRQIPSLKILESVLFPLIIIFYSLVTSLSAATTNLPPTVTSRFSEQEIQLLREAFLRKFGMKEQPKQIKPTIPVPYYMWSIYENVKKEDIAWVRHYYPHSIMELDNSTLLLQYDLSVTVRNITNEIVNRAELKLKLRNENNRKHIKIYEVDQRNSEIWRLIDAKFIESDFRENYQWVEMDVTEAIRRKRPDMNKIDFAMKLSSSLLTTYASTSHQPTSYSISPYDWKQASALVIYVQTDDTARVRKKRKANTRRRHQHKKHDHRSTNKNYCRRTQLLVDFNELNWQDWILAPSSYSAYQCQGECPNPLTSHFNTTNHAIVQGLINSVDPSLVPAPCCVPTEMESLAILYIDVEGKIVIKNYPDMEVLSCGCR